MKPKVRLMIDSGAYSAWSHGETIKLPDYVDFLRRHDGDFFSYVALDVLARGAEKGRTAGAIEEAAQRSYRNLQRMKDAGLKPIPVFHQGDDFKWLERLLDDGESYIGISTRKDIWAKGQQQWMDEVFSILCTQKGMPIVRTHGFGITRTRFILRYPWTTVDSTSWSLMPAYGQIFIPPPTSAGLPDYTREPLSIATSGKYSKTLNDKQLEGFENREMRATRDYVFGYIEDTLKIPLHRIRDFPDDRRRACLIYYTELAKHTRDIRFKAHSNSLTQTRTQTSGSTLGQQQLMIMFATSITSHNWSNIMNELGIATRLLSFYDLKGMPAERISEYIRKGTLKKGHRAKAPSNLRSEAYRNFRSIKLQERINGQSRADK